MFSEQSETRELELEGWPVALSSYRINGYYLAEVESTPSGTRIAMIVAATREAAEKEALATAAARLLRTVCFDPGLTVGG